MKKPAKPMKDSPALQRREEKLHKDLDHDGEKGEPMAHRIKVLGKKKAMATAKPKPKKK